MNILLRFHSIVLLAVLLFSANNRSEAQHSPLPIYSQCKNSANLFADDFIHNMQSENYNKAEETITNWEQCCGLREPVLRAKILHAIVTDKLSEDVYDEKILDYVQNYMQRKSFIAEDLSKEECDFYAASLGHIPINDTFDQFTLQVAQLSTDPDNELEELFTLLYSGEHDAFYEYINTKLPKDKALYKAYKKEVNRYSKLPESYFEIFTGTFMPNWELNFIGSHPEIGIAAGIRFPVMSYQFILSARTNKSQESFLVKNESTIARSNDFFGSYFGLQTEATLFKNDKSEFAPTASIGYDRFATPITGTENFMAEAAGITFSIGSSYKYHLSKKLFVNINYQYNIANFSSEDILNDLKGDYHTIRLAFGGFFDGYKHGKLKELGYKQ